MSDACKLIIEPLNKTHDRPGFRCGSEALDTYLKRQAGQDMKRGINRVFIAIKPDTPTKVIGFYSLSSVSIELNHLPETLVRKLPKHPIPGALIGRLAVSQAYQGKGVGKMLLADAVKRVLSISDDIAVSALVVDAIDNIAQNFYEQFGFIRLIGNGSRLFLPLKSL